MHDMCIYTLKNIIYNWTVGIMYIYIYRICYTLRAMYIFIEYDACVLRVCHAIYDCCTCDAYMHGL